MLLVLQKFAKMKFCECLNYFILYYLYSRRNINLTRAQEYSPIKSLDMLKIFIYTIIDKWPNLTLITRLCI
jgi:hypothetical protein